MFAPFLQKHAVKSPTLLRAVSWALCAKNVGLTMPIANCVITQECTQSSGNLIDLWATESGMSPEHMTINIVTSSEQLGNKYKIMANLALPSMWSTSDVSLLQIGLAKALAKHFSIAINEVHVITNIITSGMVVESGQEIKW